MKESSLKIYDVYENWFSWKKSLAKVKNHRIFSIGFSKYSRVHTFNVRKTYCVRQHWFWLSLSKYYTEFAYLQISKIWLWNDCLNWKLSLDMRHASYPLRNASCHKNYYTGIYLWPKKHYQVHIFNNIGSYLSRMGEYKSLQSFRIKASFFAWK